MDIKDLKILDIPNGRRALCTNPEARPSPLPLHVAEKDPVTTSAPPITILRRGEHHYNRLGPPGSQYSSDVSVNAPYILSVPYNLYVTSLKTRLICIS